MPFIPDSPTPTIDKGIKPSPSFVSDEKPTTTFEPERELKPIPEHIRVTTRKGIIKTAALSNPLASVFLREKDVKVTEQMIVNYVNTLGFGLPEKALEKVGFGFPKPETPAERVGAGLGTLGGFIGGPLKIAGRIAPRLPFIGRAFRPAATITQAVAKPIIRGAATLGTASALMTPEAGVLALPERIRQFGSGAMTGGVFGGISFIPSKPLRMILNSAYLGVPSSLKEEPLEQQIFNYGLGAWIGRKGVTPSQLLGREKPLVEMARYGTNKPERFLVENERLIRLEKELALKTGKDPISRQEQFSQTIGKKSSSSLLELAQKTVRGQNLKKWKTQTIRDIKRRIIELKRDPHFQLESGDADFITNYITKDLGFKTSELAKLDNAEILNISNFLNQYRPPADSPFFRQPPLKPIYAGRDWRIKINPWDRTLRGGLRKLEKLGFGKVSQIYEEEGLTNKFFTSGATKAQFMQRYMEMRNNWIRTTGTNKQRSNDMFEYLDGKSHPKFLTKMHGEKTLKVADQMRSFLDTLLVHQNRHRAMYGEEPIQARKNYITHLFEDAQAEIIAKKHPFPDWLSDALPYIIPQRKTSPFLLPRRTGRLGFQKDIWRALDAYTYRASQVIGDEPIRRANKVSRFLDKQMDLERTLKRKTGEVSEVDWFGIKSNLDDYTKDIQGRPGKLDQTFRALIDPLNSVLSILPNQPQIRSINDITDGMVSLIYGSQMAYRPKLPIRNLGQHSLIIGQTGFKPLGWAIANRNSQEAREIVKHSKLLASRQRAFGAETQALFGKGLIKKASEIGLRPFRWADIVNVEDAYLSGYKQAKDNPKKWPNPFLRGDQVAALTQYVYLAENRSDLARGWGLSKTFGRPLSIFTTWPSNWVDFQIASASNPETRMNLLKYWATALTITGITATMGIKGAEYVGISSPLSLLQIAKGKLPITGVAERPGFQALREWNAWLEGDKTLKEILFYTFRKR